MRASVVRAFPIGAIALLMLLSVSPASACNCPTLMIVGPAGAAARNVAGPGDRVSYTITQLTDDARWTLVVNGSEIDRGVASGTQVSGAFVVPDLGDSSRDVSVAAQVAHEDFDQDGCPTRPFDTLSYTIPAPSPSEPSGIGAPQGDEQIGGDESAPDGRRPERPQDPTRHRHEHPTSTPPRAKPHGAPLPPMTHLGPTHVTAAPQPTDPPIGEGSSVDSPSSTDRAHEAGTRAPVSAPTGQVGAVPFRSELRSARTDSDERLADATRGGIPIAALIALGVLMLAGIAGGGWTLVRMRRRPSPQPNGARAVAPPEILRAGFDAELSRMLSREHDPAAVEAELQELIAEERARRVSREAGAIRTGPG